MALPSTDTKGWGAKQLTASTTATSLGLGAHTRALVLKNPSSNTASIYLGGSDLTSGNATTEGFPLEPGEVLTFDEAVTGVAQVTLYYIVTASTATFYALGGNV